MAMPSLGTLSYSMPLPKLSAAADKAPLDDGGAGDAASDASSAADDFPYDDASEAKKEGQDAAAPSTPAPGPWVPPWVKAAEAKD